MAAVVEIDRGRAGFGVRPGGGSERDKERSAHPLPNRDLDTGNVVQPGGYPLTDETHASLLHALTSQPKIPIPPGIKVDIQAYYTDLDAPIATRKDPQRWKQVLADLEILKGMPTSPVAEAYPTYEEGEMQKQAAGFADSSISCMLLNTVYVVQAIETKHVI